MRERQIGDLAINAIDWIIDSECVSKKVVDYHIKRNATFSNVMQYLWTYVGNDAPINNPNNYARYRICRYRNALSRAQFGQGRIQHIDLGCGGGTFAHALLEWCQVRGIEFDKVTLYGYDYAPNMIKAARMIYRRIRSQHSEPVPTLYSYSNFNLMLEEMPTHLEDGTHNIITIGYVLANNSDAIDDFTAIIAGVIQNANDNHCSLIASGATTSSDQFRPAYDELVGNLETVGVQVNTWREGAGLRIAELSC